MCDQINPELRTRMIREMAEEVRQRFREWRRRNTVTSDLGLQRSIPWPTDSTYDP